MMESTAASVFKLRDGRVVWRAAVGGFRASESDPWPREG